MILAFIKRHLFVLIIAFLGLTVLLLCSFKAGVSLGFSKSFGNCAWNENYHRNFGGPPPMGLRVMMDRDASWQSHGVFGRVIEAATDTVMIKQNDGVEKVVKVTPTTIIQLLNQRVPLTEVHVNEDAVVIGEPNDQGQVVATFIRLLPPPPTPPTGADDSFFYRRLP